MDCTSKVQSIFYNSSINVDNIFFPLKAVEKSINYEGFLEGIPAFLGYFFVVPFAFIKEMNARCASPIENLYTSSTFPPRRKIADFAAATSFSHYRTGNTQIKLFSIFGHACQIFCAAMNRIDLCQS